MIDDIGHRLYSEMMCLLTVDENNISTEVEDAMAAFDKHMNVLNGTTGTMYGKRGEILMRWGV